jgi:hypothetical protein
VEARAVGRTISRLSRGAACGFRLDGCILGSASSLLIDWDDYAESANWSLITGDGSFDTHNPQGMTLYGADMGVDPDGAAQGIGTLFYEARKD